MSPSYLNIHSVTGEKLEVDIDYKDLYLGTCTSIHDFEKLNRIGEGKLAYGVVYRAKDKRNNTVVALKAVRIFDNDRYSGIPITTLREISILRSLKHKNIISVLEVAVGKALDDIYMVEEYCEQDMASIMDAVSIKYTQSEVKCLTKQLLEGVEYLHKQNIIHRDLKMSNLLLNAKGILKIADFGMAREYRENGMTPHVVTIWYRSPELLFGKKNYTSSVDLWSVGCILGELITSVPLLPGQNETEQVQLIANLLGTPNEAIWPEFRKLPLSKHFHFFSSKSNMIKHKFSNQTTATKDLLNRLLTYDPEKRISAKIALNHEYFKESPQTQDPSLLPTFPEIRNQQKNDHKRQNKTISSKYNNYIFDNSDIEQSFGKRIKK
ncbi:uncharacterized protein T551_02588 [Pneumocystis jirovecii RU7]|uniref:Protein kinase domain-containing protein n=1 Tax=Pneumocystis jirovecii (strain RU7) TaxID=1408657 RepID=A0A0W4ZK34_PNEJ7|nr:uncharacterized protein T551_02588 [Pneumocystis jirovecii RU7]KTW28738.1 hypothetical protein T551_02588 [Pneumocystis jirovecii RU7]